MSHEITSHRVTPVTPCYDPNALISISATDADKIGMYTRYLVEYGDRENHTVIPFNTWLQVGVTDTVLLAIVLDRLTAHQASIFGCPEYAIVAAHVAAALAVMKDLTARRSVAVVLPQESQAMANDKPDRVYVGGAESLPEDHKFLHVGVAAFSAAFLGSWAAWSDVERAAKALNPPITGDELAVIERHAAQLPGAANGHTEFAQAMAQTQRA